jgi:pimeloyl-ACP methyl ester carboxylesterase
MTFMEQTLSFTDPHGRIVSAVLQTPIGTTDRIVILCHGFLSNKNSTTNKVLTSLLTGRGVATFRFDFMGQGESQGPFEQITVGAAVEQALGALELVKGKGFGRVGMIGSSFGGLVALLAAAQRRDLLALGLKCPVPDFPEMLRLEFGKDGQDGIAEWRRTGTIPNVSGGAGRIRLAYQFFEECLTHQGYDAAKAITASTLIVQGDCDEFVPLHQSRRLFEALQVPKGLHILPGADHTFTKGSDFRMMTGLLSDWMVRHLDGDAHAVQG